MSAVRADVENSLGERSARQIASSYFASGQLRSARAVLSEAAQEEHAGAGVLSDLATVEFLLGNAAQAENALARALEIDETYLPAWRNLAELLLATNRFDSAVQIIERIAPYLSAEEQKRFLPHLARDCRENPDSPHAQERVERTWRSLRALPDILCCEIHVDAAAFAAFTCVNPIALAPAYYQKKLEYYLSTLALNLESADRFVDIASQGSPFPAYVQRIYECDVFQQDLEYAKGWHERKIGGDAAAMPVPDGFFTKMSLHCSFEHFEGDADTRFILEAARVLRPGGKLCIVPLYASMEASEQRFATYSTSGGAAELGAGCQFCRTYSAASFARRVAGPAGAFFDVALWRTANLDELRARLPSHQNLYANFMAVLTRR